MRKERMNTIIGKSHQSEDNTNKRINEQVEDKKKKVNNKLGKGK